jgi:hypothetical protein
MYDPNDPNDLSPWYYTAMLTGRGGDLAEGRAVAVDIFHELIAEDTDDLNVPRIRDNNARVRDNNARVREWMRQRPAAARYCFELDAIHEDLQWILSEMDAACDPPTHRPDLMRISVIYHVQNYHYRVYAYLEKLAQLINAVLELGLAEERQVNPRRVLEKLGRHKDPACRPIHDLLRGLMKDPQIRAIVDRRILLTHRALVEYHKGKNKWQFVTSEDRAQAYFALDQVQEVQLWSDLQGFHSHEAAEMRRIVGRLEGFRHDLTEALRQIALGEPRHHRRWRHATRWRALVTRAAERLSNFGVQRTPRRRR